MFSRPAFFLLGIFVVSLEMCYCGLSCDYFKTNSAHLEADSSVTLRFTPNDDCHNKSNTVEIVTVLKWKDESSNKLICYVYYKTECKPISNNCACDKQSQDFSVTWHIDGESQNETLLLSIEMQNGEERRQRIPVKLSSQQSQFTTVDPVLSESQTTTTTVDPALSESQTSTIQGDATANKAPAPAPAPAIQNKHVLIGLVVLSVAVVVVFGTLTITCRLQLQNLKMLSRKRSVTSGSRTGHHHNANGRRNLAVDPAALYRGQNVSVIITNELYESSGGAVGREGAVWGHVPIAPRDRMQPPEDARGGETMVAGGALPHCGEGDYAEIGNPVQRDEQHCKQKKPVVNDNTSNEGEGDYAEIGTPVQRDEQHCKQKKPVVDGNTSNGGACGGMDRYVDVEDIRRRKAEQKRQKEAAEGEGDYPETGTPVQRDEQYCKQKKPAVNDNTSNGAGCGIADLYVDVEDIRRRKAEQRIKEEAAGGSCGEENLYANVKPYIRVRKVKQRKRKAAAGVAAVIPGTTVNPLCEYVEELEAKRQRNKEKEKAEETETRK